MTGDTSTEAAGAAEQVEGKIQKGLGAGVGVAG
jgi:uncharacterized protein YjbJ (UPF0337 family)